MGLYKLLVMSNPVEGREDEYNDWYTNVHLADVTAVPGFVKAQRFRLRHPVGFDHAWRYCAIYEVETDDPDMTVEALLSRQGSEQMVVSEALDLETAKAGLFEACSDVVFARQADNDLT